MAEWVFLFRNCQCVEILLILGLNCCGFVLVIQTILGLVDIFQQVIGVVSTT
jgi:hypothetical protein